MRSACRSFAVGLLVVVVLVGSAWGDWPQFRGPNSSGIGSGEEAPVEFGPGKNELWRLPMKLGHSSPCVVGDSIYLTTFDEETKKLAIVRIDREKGKVVWERDVPVEKLERGHPSFVPASSSPTADSERVVAYFGSFGLVCFDKAGKKLWERRMPVARSYGGNATSPAIFGDRVVLYRGNYVDHFLAAFDKRTGKELWRVRQQEHINGEMACTSCPILAGKKLIVHTARSVQAFDIATGKRLWVVKCATTATSTPVLAGNQVLVAAWNKLGEPALRPPFPSFDKLVEANDKDGDGLISRGELPRLWIFHRPEGAEAPQNGATVRFESVDRNRNRRIDEAEWVGHVKALEKFRAGYETHGILSIPLVSEGLVPADKIRSLETKHIPEVPSPVCDGKYLYFVKNGGMLTCLDVKTGEHIYRMRTGGRGTHYASPLVCAGKLYTVAGDGRITVLTTGPKPKILATNRLGERVYASPALVDGVLYVRTHSALFAFGTKTSR